MLSLDQWRSRPMQVRVLEPCPRCKQMAENVQKRTLYGRWLQRFEETSCEPCAKAMQHEYMEA